MGDVTTATDVVDWAEYIEYPVWTLVDDAEEDDDE
jgi:hypothetical protein